MTYQLACRRTTHKSSHRSPRMILQNGLVQKRLRGNSHVRFGESHDSPYDSVGISRAPRIRETKPVEPLAKTWLYCATHVGPQSVGPPKRTARAH